MAILYDFSGSIHAALHVDLKHSDDVHEDFIRHLIINQLRNAKVRNKQYGELVICLDNHSDSYWRKDVFPYYKYKRKQVREASKIDWALVYKIVNKITEEIVEYLPFKVLNVPKCEADDLIGVLAIEQPWGKDELFGDSEPVLIYSNDKDFTQLHSIKNVKQYYPRKGKIEKHLNPDLYLFEHVIKGDAGDGIPNILSDEDTFVSLTKRQSPVRAKFLRDVEKFGVPEQDRERWKMNNTLINLKEIPDEYKKKIIQAYKESNPSKNQMKLLKYFGQNRLIELRNKISDFF